MVEGSQWIQSLQRGDADALCEVYTHYKNELYSLAMVLCRNQAMSEDALQDVFVMLAQKGNALKIRASLKAYLAMCIVNRIRSWQRSKLITGLPPEAAQIADSTPLPEARLQQHETAGQIQQALGQLPSDQREVIVMHLHSGLTFRDIALESGLSINTVQSRYRYSLEKLRSMLNGGIQR
jgi:RNA polymerase sigma-70 factor (ECF subfamily)